MILFEKKIPSSFEFVNEMVIEILEVLKLKGINDIHDLFRINFVLRELLNNAVEHGNVFNMNKNVFCKVESDYEILRFYVKDEGEGFDLATLENELIEVNDTPSQRTRGFSTINALGFTLKSENNVVVAEISLKGDL